MHEQLEAAWQGGEKPITLRIKGQQFRIDFKAMTQTNVEHPDRVRRIHRISAVRCTWYSVAGSPATGDWKAEPLPENVTDLIESGLGDRCWIGDALCIMVEHDGLSYCVDKVAMCAHVYRKDTYVETISVVSVPKRLVSHLPSSFKLIRMDMSSPTGAAIIKRFEETKMSLRDDIHNAHVNVVSIDCAVEPRLCLEFWQTVALKMARSSETRILLAFHGTTREAAGKITKGNFYRKMIGASTGNDGWFGKGFYLSERAYTALGYQKGYGTKTLLGCLVVVEKTFECPRPDSSDNPYHGQPCKKGYDSHYSPGCKELVVFSARQILPCFLLNLNTDEFDSNSRRDYDGKELIPALVQPRFQGRW